MSLDLFLSAAQFHTEVEAWRPGEHKEAANAVNTAMFLMGGLGWLLDCLADGPPEKWPASDDWDVFTLGRIRLVLEGINKLRDDLKRGEGCIASVRSCTLFPFRNQ